MPFRMETDGWDFSYLVEVPFFSSISCKTNLPRSHFVEVPHIQQLSTWDCGLACVLMVLKTLGIDCGDIPCLEKLCCTTSVWTVDLAHLLHKFSVKFFFLTVTLGANPNYAVESFYQDNLPDDIRRVNGQFQVALENGINIQGLARLERSNQASFPVRLVEPLLGPCQVNRSGSIFPALYRSEVSGKAGVWVGTLLLHLSQGCQRLCYSSL
ncbi:uncharacterized protein LOC18440208 isoform X2 [Amborella trichopoda]|uniref:uncharacterized protein LOC18440208 isoform X2 n=1 Tax=Amborella trichopoda TaxID=13333 RepID=UPI0009C192A5|nr:uncharacterized protein LOC18440208 isoform X2 [Amborella trichopoda]|eukprot:XP_020526594.1 uncharacterized protein LOC18440208 isoform X2 [Amborella trichopoda]